LFRRDPEIGYPVPAGEIMRTIPLAVALLALGACSGPGAPRATKPQKLAIGSPSAEAPIAAPIAPAAPEEAPADEAPADPDRDGDGVLDVDDKCPTEPEIYNGRDDADGCPDASLVVVSGPGDPIVMRVRFARR
jgi:hypothetical protein